MGQKRQSITDYPLINRGLQESESLYSKLGYTVESLEKALAKAEYTVDQPFKFDSKKDKETVKAVEKLTGFNYELANLFEVQCLQLGRIPTQHEFSAESLHIVAESWHDADDSNTELLEWTETVEKAVMNRNLRTYVAQVNEFHCSLLIAELFPDWTVYSSNELDIIMGVDIVVETADKRLYFHLFKNSSFSFQAYRKKRFRGGRRNSEGKFIKYHRDFTGDKSLMYDSTNNMASGTTKFINSIPLFKAEWLKDQLTMYGRFEQFGEPLANSKKLQQLEQFLTEIEEEAENEIA